MRRTAVAGVLLLATASILGAGRRHAVEPDRPLPLTLDARRSFAITDQAILDAFSFRRVMDAIVRGSATSPATLIEQMFDTQNAPACDDLVNGLPRHCPTPEGALAHRDPFADDYIPLAVVNRFDQTPADGSNCGQYRIIFARRSDHPADRMHLIFEAVLPNPHPERGIAACRPVAAFWASLSGMNSLADRRAALEQFFFDGIDGFAPAFASDHYSLASGGGIRTLENTGGTALEPRFYQFRIEKKANELRAMSDVLEDMPFGRYFDASDDTPEARDFRDAFIRSIAALAVDDVNLYSIDVPRRFLLTESDPVDGELDFAFTFIFRRASNSAFRDRIDAELRRIGSPLSAENIVERAETRSCTGCHTLFGSVGGNVVFPRTIDEFQHVSENFVEPGDDGPRFQLSPAMWNVFIPHRMEILERFLASGTPPVHSN